MSRRQRGAALLIVLWASTLLAILLGGFAVVARIQAVQARHLFDQIQAHYVVEAVVVRTLYLLLEGPAADQQVPVDGTPRRLDQDGYLVAVSARDDRGKIDLNQASPELLRAWFEHAGGTAAGRLAETVVAWRRSGPSAARAGAGGDEAFEGVPFDGPLTDLEVLGRIPGMTAALRRTLLEDATLWSGQARPDLALASTGVLAAYAALDPRAVAQARQQQPLADHAPGSAAASEHRGTVVTLTASAVRDRGVVATLTVTARLQARDSDRAYAVLRWQEGGAP
ncbi:type II secretion system minor pseudopilin [Frateuria aurantia]